MSLYEEMAAICELSSDEMLKAVPGMIYGDAPLYY